jgi:Cof subfamily protein (haloacid dehalogenase superfamily)
MGVLDVNIKLIAIDLDGTLLDSKKRLSDVNRKVLIQCIQKKIWIVPCTGRTLYGIPKEVKDISGIRYAITTNGAVIEDMEEKTVIGTRMLSREHALELLRLVDSYHVMYDPYIDRRGITEPRFYEHLSEYSLTVELQEMVRMTRDVCPNIIEFVEKNDQPVEKINLFFPDMEDRARRRAELEKRGDILVTSSIPNNLEINAIGATKGEAILRLASHLGISEKQIMAIGDGENDFSMIQKAGIGVAMKNGSKELYAAADYITDTNDENGVASAIDHFVFGAKD